MWSRLFPTDCAKASSRWDILAIPGVEITHVPKEDIDLAAREAKAMGARLVNVHGETVVEPVDPGTNSAAVNSSYVDILAHPGLLTLRRRAWPVGTAPSWRFRLEGVTV